MRLHEEYFMRHGITDVPVVQHCSAGSLILQPTDVSRDRFSSQWILLSIRWKDDDHHPGKYHISIDCPIHDGYQKDQLFTAVGLGFCHSPIILKWDLYENFLLDLVSNLPAIPVVGDQEVVMATWEMFVFSHDSWFLKQPYSIKKSLFESLDKENPIQLRYQNYQDVALFISTHHPAILRSWKYEVLARVQNYANWLAAIVNTQCKLESS